MFVFVVEVLMGAAFIPSLAALAILGLMMSPRRGIHR